MLFAEHFRAWVTHFRRATLLQNRFNIIDYQPIKNLIALHEKFFLEVIFSRVV
jgi:hypothetical protein